MATSLPCHPLLPSSKSRLNKHRRSLSTTTRHAVTIQAFGRSDFDGFAQRVTSGEAWRNAWQSANDVFEKFLFDARKTAERLDRQYSVSRRFNSVFEFGKDRARELDREFEIGRRWRSLTVDFSRNWPRYRKQLSDFLDTPLGRSFATIFFLWFALSGWLFRFLIFGTWILPFAAPLLIGTFAKNFAIEGACPACRRRFVGYKNQIVRCAGCGNIVWQPKNAPFTRGGKGNTPSSTSGPDIIDVEFEEK